MTDLVAIGEVMLELSSTDAPHALSTAKVGVAGDTFNTAVYAARHGANVAYFTQLGDDPYSAKMLALLADEGINTEGIVQLEGREPGLYMIANRADGERTFHYWRSQSPAREMLTTASAVALFRRCIERSKIVYLSGITLAILPDQALDALHQSLCEYKAQGGQVAFDSNYRPRLWQSHQKAKAVIQRFMSITDIALLTDEDEQNLWGCESATQVAQQHVATAVKVLIVKRGAKDVVSFTRTEGDDAFLPPVFIDVPQVKTVVDTTAAGDSFNGAFLAAHLAGKSLSVSISCANQCAGSVIKHRGAIAPKNATV
ncbi:sugar kinase [Marinagarivorans cellulosilyticus]|uniref:2-dehydro-3-deoxygluconokinase n=1 Tax=Marinagarivorans cellulosilyticus TaxID=2721545 RepID=A0AAN1WJJ3_9GAMM|nr:sugar kinase [Marinagarivorans cellulosilyticus]BCD98754.1 2-dehydro-3-deoxygluconokinase [Marinagarivorans cellulosilyticus]